MAAMDAFYDGLEKAGVIKEAAVDEREPRIWPSLPAR
jgi:hypothetical protein